MKLEKLLEQFSPDGIYHPGHDCTIALISFIQQRNFYCRQQRWEEVHPKRTFWVFDKSRLYSFKQTYTQRFLSKHFAKQINERLALCFLSGKQDFIPQLFTKCTNRETVKSRSEPSKVFLLAPVRTGTMDERTQDIP